jgi:hypothetical protein
MPLARLTCITFNSIKVMCGTLQRAFMSGSAPTHHMYQQIVQRSTCKRVSFESGSKSKFSLGAVLIAARFGLANVCSVMIKEVCCRQ